MDVRTQEEPTNLQAAASGWSDLSFEVSCLRKDLIAHYRQSRWAALAEDLGILARIGEIEGQKELCLGAQALRDLVRTLAAQSVDFAGTEPSLEPTENERSESHDRLHELFQDLFTKITHFQWTLAN